MNKESILLEDLQDLLKNKQNYKLQTEKGHQGISNFTYDGEQEEYNETLVFYKHPGLPDNVFMKETYRTDSYGNNDFLYSVEFIEGKAKTITVYEPI